MMLDSEHWKIVLKVYTGHPVSAPHSRSSTYCDKAISPARAQRNTGRYRRLDLAIDSLFSHTDFYKMGHKFYLRTIEGTVKPEQEEKLRQFGVKL
jgi:hypothetical protein